MARHFDNERDLQTRIEQTVTSVAGVDVLDVELDNPRQTVRVFISHPDGVTHDLCTTVTRLLVDLNEEFSVEVSSPGLERPLRHPRHFAAAIGEQVRLQQGTGTRARTVTILDADENEIVVLTGDDEELVIPYDEIIRCRVVVDTAAILAAANAKKKKGRA